MGTMMMWEWPFYILIKALVVDIKYNGASSKLRQKKNMLEVVGEMYVRYQKKKKKSRKE